MSNKSVKQECLTKRCGIVSSKGILQECHLSVSTQGVSQVGSLENVRNKYCLCSSTYVSAFGFVGFILFFLRCRTCWPKQKSFDEEFFARIFRKVQLVRPSSGWVNRSYEKTPAWRARCTSLLVANLSQANGLAPWQVEFSYEWIWWAVCGTFTK